MAAYEKFLRGKITANGKIVPIPDVSHQKLVDRVIRKKKPFRGNGKGYQDALIWETILELTQKDGFESLALITGNTEDFADKNKEELHPDLISDLIEIKVDPDTVKLFTSLEEFIQSEVLPSLEEIQEIIDSIIAGTNQDIDLSSIAEEYIWDLIPGFEINPDCLPEYKEDNLDLTLSSGVSEYNVVFDDLEVKRLSGKDILIIVSYEMECEIDVFVPKWEFYDEAFKELGFYVVERDWNKKYLLAGITLPFKLTLRYVFDQENQSVTSADLITAECLEKYEW